MREKEKVGNVNKKVSVVEPVGCSEKATDEYDLFNFDVNIHEICTSLEF